VVIVQDGFAMLALVPVESVSTDTCWPAAQVIVAT
jgi:hypothetical protein